MPLLDSLFLLFFGHALADFVLQPQAMGYGKNRNDKIHDIEHSLFPNWWYWLSAHALVHGGVVYLICALLLDARYALLLALTETVAHWLIDFAKCESRITVHQDQALHLGLKVIYALLITAGVA